jgi:hypothetical protein
MEIILSTFNYLVVKNEDCYEIRSNPASFSSLRVKPIEKCKVHFKTFSLEEATETISEFESQEIFDYD